MARRGQGRRTARVLAGEELEQVRAVRGRPKQRWHYGLVAFVGEGWFDVAADRDWWKDIVDEAPNLVVWRLDGGGW